jgi:hypothetical protein
MRKRRCFFVQVDYGSGVMRLFSFQQVKNVERLLGIRGRIAFRDATREWVESLPESMPQQGI